jgi:hypothetical protein
MGAGPDGRAQGHVPILPRVSASLTRRLRTLPATWLGGGLAAIGLGVSAFFGGLTATATSGPPTTAVDTTITGQPWDVVVTGARLIAPDDSLTVRNPGDHWLVVVATVTVTSGESRDDIDDVLRVTGAPGVIAARPARVLLARDGTDVVYLNPGMPESVGFFFEQAGTSTPKTVDIQVYGETLRPDNLAAGVHGGNLGWFDPTVTATVTAPVEDRRR